ncbi:WD repeat-containing protein WRAP73 [Histomonas meleagridis]|uniref:WD repeat-containing protein WRAP73 n=1 Tax=Histomonas meleagridis TaxID=135588 RepID=UPI003559BF93|nr:WD repeat-containing protein WRAP73 [Histomonas meleagridis]KAH0799564.1 WD repeat-containing protein WRAP73 [Histomonas meleagridis]
MLFQAPFTCDCWTKEFYSLSEDGKTLAAVINGFKVEIHDASTGNSIITLRCIDKIDKVLWSPNGRHLAVAMYERNTVHIFTPSQSSQPYMRIDGGELGIENIMWSPNNRYLLVFGKDGVRIDVWELRKSMNQLICLLNVKDSRKGVSFSPDKNFFAYLTRIEGSDCISIFSSEDWRPIDTIKINTLDACEIQWSPNSQYIAISDCQIEHRAIIVNLETQNCSEFQAYKEGVGISCMRWCFNSCLLAIGSGNDSIYILYAPDWKLLAEFNHINITRKEIADHYIENTPGEMIKSDFPIEVRNYENSGITKIEWSNSGKYVASTSAAIPQTVFIWDIESLSLIHVFSFLTEVTDMKWSPTDDNLALGYGTDMMLNWKPNGFNVSHSQEAAIRIHFIEWKPDGELLIVFDCIAGTCTFAHVLHDNE